VDARSDVDESDADNDDDDVDYTVFECRGLATVHTHTRTHARTHTHTRGASRPKYLGGWPLSSFFLLSLPSSSLSLYLPLFSLFLSPLPPTSP